MRAFERGEEIRPRKGEDDRAHERDGDGGELILAGPDGETGAHGEEDETDIARLADVATEADDRERGKHAERRRQVTHDDKDHERDDRAEDEQGVDVVLRVARATVGALVRPSDQGVEREAEEDREENLFHARLVGVVGDQASHRIGVGRHGVGGEEKRGQEVHEAERAGVAPYRRTLSEYLLKGRGKIPSAERVLAKSNGAAVAPLTSIRH